MNQVILIGRLTRDPELSYTANSQTPVAHFTLAVDRPSARRNEGEQTADFIRVTVFGKQAEISDRYLSKGRQVAIHGRIQTGSYTNREGARVYTTDVIADRVEFLGSGSGNGGGRGGQGYDNGGQRYDGGNGGNSFSQPDMNDLPDAFQAVEDDIPF